jgi:phosphohistidine phosphatase
MAVQRTLAVVRHAKSDWSTGMPDARRPLADRGRRDAPVIGTWLAGNLAALDLVVCSPATRAMQTWDLASAGLDPKPEVRLDERVYGASPAELTTVLAELPDEIRTVAVVGHNPGLADLVELLTGELRELKTSAVAVLRWTGSWADTESGTATLDAYTTPRG